MRNGAELNGNQFACESLNKLKRTFQHACVRPQDNAHTHTHTLVLPEMREDERGMGKMLKLLAKQINNKDGECERIPAAGIEAKVLLILNQEAGGGFHAKKARYVAWIKVLSQSPTLLALSFSAQLTVSFGVAPLRLCLRSHLDWQCYKINTLRGRRGRH